MKNKNLLAENMLRFRAKNLSETTKRKIVRMAEIITEQTTPDGTSNITLQLNDIMAGRKVARIDGTSRLYAFPTRAENQGASPKPGDVATYNGESAIFSIGNNDNEYIVVGDIGTLDKTGQSIQNEQPQAFKVGMQHETGEGYGRVVKIKIAPFKAVNVVYTIAQLLKKTVPTNDQNLDRDLTDTSKKFIDNMIATFKLVGMAGDISNMDTLYKNIRAYI